jgi:hypothetical protein
MKIAIAMQVQATLLYTMLVAQYNEVITVDIV